jgi:hypothetical protein
MIAGLFLFLKYISSYSLRLYADWVWLLMHLIAL